MSFATTMFVGHELVKCMTRHVCTFVRTSCLCCTLFWLNKYLGTIPLTKRWTRYFWITSTFMVEFNPTNSSTMTTCGKFLWNYSIELLWLLTITIKGCTARTFPWMFRIFFFFNYLCCSNWKLTSLIVVVETTWPPHMCFFSYFLYTIYGTFHFHGVVGFLE